MSAGLELREHSVAGRLTLEELSDRIEPPTRPAREASWRR
jgi:hypothetical protein